VDHAHRAGAPRPTRMVFKKFGFKAATLNSTIRKVD
jgi:hypothetical protein